MFQIYNTVQPHQNSNQKLIDTNSERAKGVVYMLTCKLCTVTETCYIGETGRELRYRLYEHFTNQRQKESCLKLALTVLKIITELINPTGI